MELFYLPNEQIAEYFCLYVSLASLYLLNCQFRSVFSRNSKASNSCNVQY